MTDRISGNDLCRESASAFRMAASAEPRRFLPLDSAAPTGAIAAEGILPCRMLAEMAALLGLAITENKPQRVSVWLTARRPETAFAPVGSSPWLLRHPATGVCIVRIRSGHVYTDSQQCFLLMHALHLCLLQQVEAGRGMLLHGALLYHPGKAGGIVLLGESGVGKSAAARRFAREGGEVLSDDRLFLSFDSSGGVYGQPLPTWSRFASRPAVCFSRKVPIRKMFLLFRGEDDRIVPAKTGNWLIAMYRSLSDVLYVPPGWLCPSGIRRVLEASSPWVSVLADKFGQWQIQGALDGHLHQHVSQSF